MAGVLLSVGMLAAAPAVTAEAAPATTVRSGMEIDVEESILTQSKCTLGAVVSPTRAITAGHCGEVGRAVYNARGTRIGTISANRITKGLDIAVIRLAPRQRVQVDRIDWNAGFFRGQVVTKNGVTTGFSRGVVTDPKPTKRTARGIVWAPPFLLQHSTVSVRGQRLGRPRRERPHRGHPVVGVERPQHRCGTGLDAPGLPAVARIGSDGCPR